MRFNSLDHWRGLACLLVVVYHSTLMSMATGNVGTGTDIATRLVKYTATFNVGVALFFVISGYCIAAAADNVRKRDGSVSDYFWRRFRRIYPPYWMAIAVAVSAFVVLDYGWRQPLLSSPPWAQLRPSWFSLSQWLGNLTLTETWRHHLVGGPHGHFVGQSWTLCYEEQFYFVVGMILLVARRRFFLAISAVSASTLLLLAIGGRYSIPVNGSFLDGSWLLFAAGVMAYYRIGHACGRQRLIVDLVLLAAFAASFWIAIPIAAAPVGFAFAACLPWLYRVDRTICSWTALNPLRWCGSMCYSLYLVHQIPVKAVSTALLRAGVRDASATLLVTVPACVLVAAGLGWVFYVTVERRFLNAPSQRRAQPAGTAAVLEGVPA